jgi:hypothetical protein
MAADKPITPESHEALKPRADLLRISEEIRVDCNRLSDEQREDAFRYGMQLIYGGNKAVPSHACRR